MEMPEFSSFIETIRAALRLDPAVYAAVQMSAHGLRTAILVVCLASLSESLGQSLVLFINRVRPRRFILALGISSVSHMVGFLLWTVTVWAVSTYVFGASPGMIAIGAAVGLAHAPQLLAFFELTPFLGNPFALILSLWSMLAVIVAIDVGTGLPFWQAVVTGALGWVIIQVWRRSIGRPIYAFGNWIQRRAADSPLSWKPADLPSLRRASDLVENWEKWRESLSQNRLGQFRQRQRTKPETPAEPTGRETLETGHAVGRESRQ